MTFLDAPSLIRAEQVSHCWRATASHHLVWQKIYRTEFQSASASDQSGAQVGGLGLGKKRPDQDWKSMWKVRQSLQRRWLDGHAAAIYLEGHHDTVYCVQFDEYYNT